jgi:hypothetical protein
MCRKKAILGRPRAPLRMVFAGLAFQAARRLAGQYANRFNQLFWRHRAPVLSPARGRNNSFSPPANFEPLRPHRD